MGNEMSWSNFHLSITEYCVQHNLDPDECVQRMRQRVVDETKLTVSAGIAANKVCFDRFRTNVLMFIVAF
jgi:DNA polymerase kappa